MDRDIYSHKDGYRWGSGPSPTLESLPRFPYGAGERQEFKGFPRDFPRDMPRDFARDLPRDFPKDPRELVKELAKEPPKEPAKEIPKRLRKRPNVGLVKFVVARKIAVPEQNSESDDDDDMAEFFAMEIRKTEAELSKLEKPDIPTQVVARFASLSHGSMVKILTEPEGYTEMVNRKPRNLSAVAEAPMDADTPDKAEVCKKGEKEKKEEKKAEKSDVKVVGLTKPQSLKKSEPTDKPEPPKKFEASRKVDALKKVEASKKVDAPNKVEASKKVDAPRKGEAPKKVEVPKKVETLKNVEAPKKVEALKKVEKIEREVVDLARPQSSKKIEPTEKTGTPKKAEDSAKAETAKKSETSKPTKTLREVETPEKSKPHLVGSPMEIVAPEETKPDKASKTELAKDAETEPAVAQEPKQTLDLDTKGAKEVPKLEAEGEKGKDTMERPADEFHNGSSMDVDDPVTMGVDKDLKDSAMDVDTGPKDSITVIDKDRLSDVEMKDVIDVWDEAPHKAVEARMEAEVQPAEQPEQPKQETHMVEATTKTIAEITTKATIETTTESLNETLAETSNERKPKLKSELRPEAEILVDLHPEQKELEQEKPTEAGKGAEKAAEKEEEQIPTQEAEQKPQQTLELVSEAKLVTQPEHPPPTKDAQANEPARDGVAEVTPGPEPKPKTEEMEIDQPTAAIPPAPDSAIPTVEMNRDNDTELESTGLRGPADAEIAKPSEAPRATPGPATSRDSQPVDIAPTVTLETTEIAPKLSTPLQVDDDETESEDDSYINFHGVRRYMTTPPIDELPNYSCTPWHHDRGFLGTLHSNPLLDDYVLEHLSKISLQNTEEQDHDRETYADHYVRYLKFTASNDPAAIKSRGGRLATGTVLQLRSTSMREVAVDDVLLLSVTWSESCRRRCVRTRNARSGS